MLFVDRLTLFLFSLQDCLLFCTFAGFIWIRRRKPWSLLSQEVVRIPMTTQVTAIPVLWTGYQNSKTAIAIIYPDFPSSITLMPSTNRVFDRDRKWGRCCKSRLECQMCSGKEKPILPLPKRFKSLYQRYWSHQDQTELKMSRLMQWNLLDESVQFSCHRTCHQDFSIFFIH